MGGKSKTGQVRVQATRNLDFIMEGEKATLERDDWITSLIDSHNLIELDDDDQPKSDEVEVGALPPLSPVQPVDGAVGGAVDDEAPEPKSRGGRKAG